MGAQGCKYCGIELIKGVCINMCWLLAGESNPYTPAKEEVA